MSVIIRRMENSLCLILWISCASEQLVMVAHRCVRVLDVGPFLRPILG